MPNLTRARTIRGQGLVEYILVVFLMAIVAIGVVKNMGQKTQKGFSLAADRLDKEFK